MEFEQEALHCRTPKQFRLLLRSFRSRIPYKALFVSWGYPKESQLRYFLNYGWPADFLQWYGATGLYWHSPIVREWQKTNKTYVWGEAFDRLKPEWPLEVIERFNSIGMRATIIGGEVNEDKDYFIQFTLIMDNEKKAHEYLRMFEELRPKLVGACMKVFHATLLSPRERSVLEQRMLGKSLKEIAALESLNIRTVQAHLAHIKQKLGARDLLNAVVIASRHHMALLPP